MNGPLSTTWMEAYPDYLMGIVGNRKIGTTIKSLYPDKGCLFTPPSLSLASFATEINDIRMGNKRTLNR